MSTLILLSILVPLPDIGARPMSRDEARALAEQWWNFGPLEWRGDVATCNGECLIGVSTDQGRFLRVRGTGRTWEEAFRDAARSGYAPSVEEGERFWKGGE